MNVNLESFRYFIVLVSLTLTFKEKTSVIPFSKIWAFGVHRFSIVYFRSKKVNDY